MTDRTAPVLWKLGIVTVLAGGYVLAWRALAGTVSPPAPADAVTAPRPATPAPDAAATAPPLRPPAVWIDELPADRRPVVQLPPGWRLAARDGARVVPAPGTAPRVAPTLERSAPRPVRVTTTRRPRVRTRSS